MSSVTVSNLGKANEQEIREFFSFCGKISELHHEGNTAKIRFEKESAGKTALLLDGTQLGDSDVHVTADNASSSTESAKGAEQHDEHHDTIGQEDKPRTRIIAEYLAHGYKITDQVLQRAIAFDQKNGYSTRFSKVLLDFDQRYKATDTAKSVDEKYQVTNKAMGAYNQAYNSLSSYFEKATNTPNGQKLRQFYEQGQKQVLDIHNEAMHLANLKKQGDSGNAPGSEAEKKDLHVVPGSNGQKTQCNCHANADGCPCEEGKCACSGCAKNSHSDKATEAGYGGSEKPTTT